MKPETPHKQMMEEVRQHAERCANAEQAKQSANKVIQLVKEYSAADLEAAMRRVFQPRKVLEFRRVK